MQKPPKISSNRINIFELIDLSSNLFTLKRKKHYIKNKSTFFFHTPAVTYFKNFNRHRNPEKTRQNVSNFELSYLLLVYCILINILA
jgi:hypothetical protein